MVMQNAAVALDDNTDIETHLKTHVKTLICTGSRRLQHHALVQGWNPLQHFGP
jgi:hypothetical protein